MITRSFGVIPRHEIRAVIALSWPLIIANLAMMGLNTTALMFLGRLGPGDLAAGVLATSTFSACSLFSSGLVMASMPMVAHALGRDSQANDEVRKIIQQGLLSAAVICIPIWIGLWNIETFYLWAGQPAEVAEQAAEILRSLLWGLLPYLAFCVLRGFIAAKGDASWAIWAALAGFGINVLVAWVLIFGQFGLPAMGASGTGIAIVAANVTMLGIILAVTALVPDFRRYRLLHQLYRIDWRVFADIWRVGFPSAVSLAFEVAIFNVTLLAMGALGKTTLAAYAIAIQIVSLAYMVPMSIGQAATVRVGLAFGANDRQGIRSAGTTALVLGLTGSMLIAVCTFTLPTVLIGLYVELEQAANADVIQIAQQFLKLACLFLLADAAQTLLAGVLRGLCDTRMPMIITAFGYCAIGVPTGLLLAFPGGLGGIGVWLGLILGLALVAILMAWRWKQRLKRLELTPRPSLSLAH